MAPINVPADTDQADRVRIEWTTPPFAVVFAVVVKTGLAILLCYGLVFAAGLMLLSSMFAD